MCNELALHFINNIDEFDDKSYLLSMIMYHAAPAIAGCKPSYLIIFHNKGKRNLYDLWRKHENFIRNELKVDCYELKKEKHSTAVLFYDKEQLSKILRNDDNIRFLEKYSYKNSDSIESFLERLKHRYETTCPHEMGIFLGYPIEDVIDFIEFPEKKALIYGYWKVYHNLEEAIKTFKTYDDIKDKVLKLIIKGVEPTYIINNMLICRYKN